MLPGICNFCGRHARKHQRAWALVRIGVTKLQMHDECAQHYREEGLLPTATFQRQRADGLRERVCHALEETILRRRYPEGKLWFGAPVDGVPLNFH